MVSYKLIMKLIRRFIQFINQPTLVGEILRFILVGGLATVIDFGVMGITLYACDPSLYPHFYNVFFGGGDPSPLAAALGTGLGFIVGLMANYLLSIVFVFNEKGKSSTFSGFIKFAILSAVGLGIHELGMWALFTKLGVNEWLVKILMTGVVLVYNYITRKLLIFKKSGKSEAAAKDLPETEVSDEKNQHNSPLL